jgi:hypothetical protein
MSITKRIGEKYRSQGFWFQVTNADWDLVKQVRETLHHGMESPLPPWFQLENDKKRP